MPRCRDGGGRVSPAVTRRASRRSVRAQLRHTARRPRIMPPAGGMNHPRGHAAIRWSSVDTLGGYKAPGVFPSNGPMARHFLPSTGFRWLLFPCFHGTMKCSDLLSPISPRFVSFAWRYRAVRLCSFPQARRRLEAWSFMDWQPRTRFCRHGDDRNSQVPGEPQRAYAVFSDPGGTEPPGPTVVRRGPREVEDGGSPRVIASRGSIARPWYWLSTLRPPDYSGTRRKTRFRLPARLYRVGLVTHRVPKKVSRHYTLSSFSRLFLAQPLCNEREFAEKIARFANLAFDVSS